MSLLNIPSAIRSGDIRSITAKIEWVNGDTQELVLDAFDANVRHQPEGKWDTVERMLSGSVNPFTETTTEKIKWRIDGTGVRSEVYSVWIGKAGDVVRRERVTAGAPHKLTVRWRHAVDLGTRRDAWKVSAGGASFNIFLTSPCEDRSILDALNGLGILTSEAK